ncbi:MAG: TrkA family potassium uptake protein [Firmicutes bacterium]|nr:TrkA family potassium uptake protein [Bacillota bacterium]MCL5038759.1 TrkA family potassium uptake protein [Bacillota bacterium]
MRLVIIGCGVMGALLANTLSQEGHQVTIVDNDPKAFRRLREDFDGKTVLGTGFDEEVLERAAVGSSDVVLAVTNNDNVNLFAAQLVRKKFGVPRVLVRLFDPEKEKIYQDEGLELICLTTFGARAFQAALTNERSVESAQAFDR